MRFTAILRRPHFNRPRKRKHVVAGQNATGNNAIILKLNDEKTSLVAEIVSLKKQVVLQTVLKISWQLAFE